MQTFKNFVYFHRRRIAVSCVAVSCYSGMCYSALTWKNDLLRLAVAGSLANMIVETGFHFIDTLNIRTKASEKSISAGKMMNTIWEKEGIKGFGKGFSACFYGSVCVGFIQYYNYKKFKEIYRNFFEGYLNQTAIYEAASLTA